MSERHFFPGDSSWVPADDGVTNGQSVTFQGVGKGGYGGGGDTIVQTGGGGGSGAFASVTVIVADASATYSIGVAQLNLGALTFVDAPDITRILEAGSGETGGVGFLPAGGAKGVFTIGDFGYDGEDGGAGGDRKSTRLNSSHRL